MFTNRCTMVKSPEVSLEVLIEIPNCPFAHAMNSRLLQWILLLLSKNNKVKINLCIQYLQLILFIGNQCLLMQWSNSFKPKDPHPSNLISKPKTCTCIIHVDVLLCHNSLIFSSLYPHHCHIHILHVLYVLCLLIQTCSICSKFLKTLFPHNHIL